ncbi:hypothetical protein KFE25_010393 [Diacronema lutheri]|uniref:Uncharacterized protein n=1 Tax=Diacronema lutheri TaxID=2081491 RepID=A0A8J5XER3_DIALT|nr:hypothetical protein KFE25_010393 [Diacronema lutheri]|mmetsp:Transcript_14007/g.43776  ORF Transcript_14007/g.43776 Transcript_14007/m.43776 type:complete len:252 (-) Transcript_14007:681-1436(-)
MPVVVITGASAGLGEAMALQLASAADHTVVLIARRKDALDAVAARCTGKGAAAVTAIVADVCKRDEVERAVAAVLAAHGTIDVWVNNVGRGCNVLPSALTDADVSDMMQVNVMSAIYCMQAVLPHFKARRTGTFVNVSSMLGRIPHISTIRSAYSASKHFLNGITGSFAAEHAAEYPDIVFALASPGVIGTDFGLTAGSADSRTLPGAQDVDECAAAIIDGAIRKRQRETYTQPAHKAMMRQHLESLVPAE